jgi:hypothetical protein
MDERMIPDLMFAYIKSGLFKTAVDLGSSPGSRAASGRLRSPPPPGRMRGRCPSCSTR